MKAAFIWFAITLFFFMHAEGGVTSGSMLSAKGSTTDTDLTLRDIIAVIVHTLGPKHVAVFGIGEGAAVSLFDTETGDKCSIQGFDSFDEPEGDRANFLQGIFGHRYPKVTSNLQ